MLLGVQYHSSFYTINDSIVHFSYELRKKIYFKSISFFNHFVSSTDLCFLFLSFSFLLFSLSLILLAYFYFFLRISRVTCSCFLSSLLSYRWNAYFRSVRDHSQEIYSLINIRI